MASIAHKNLTDPQLHEPKGVSTAPINTACFSDGNGHSVWSAVTPDKLSFERPLMDPVSAPTEDPVASIDIGGMSGSITHVIADASTFTGVNKNTKEVADTCNKLISHSTKVEQDIESVRQALNKLVQALQTIGIIDQGVIE